MPSLALSTEEDKNRVRRALPTAKIYTATVARLYVAYPNPNKWAYSGIWGAVAFLKDKRKHSYYIRIVDLMNHRSIVWEQELYDGFQFTRHTPFFYSFATDEYMAGLSFAELDDAEVFYSKITTRENNSSNKKKEKPNGKKPIGGLPSEFRHVGHIGYTPDQGFSVQKTGPEWNSLFDELQDLGISPRELHENEDFIKEFVNERSGPPPPPPPPPRPASVNTRTLSRSLSLAEIEMKKGHKEEENTNIKSTEKNDAINVIKNEQIQPSSSATSNDEYFNKIINDKMKSLQDNFQSELALIVNESKAAIRSLQKEQTRKEKENRQLKEKLAKLEAELDRKTDSDLNYDSPDNDNDNDNDLNYDSPDNDNDNDLNYDSPDNDNDNDLNYDSPDNDNNDINNSSECSEDEDNIHKSNDLCRDGNKLVLKESYADPNCDSSDNEDRTKDMCYD